MLPWYQPLFSNAAAHTVSGGGGPSYTTWDPSNTSGGVTLSGGNLVYTGTLYTAGGDSTRSIANHSSGKYYMELTVTAIVSGNIWALGFGVCNSSFVLTNAPLAGNANSAGVFLAGDGNFYLNNAPTSVGMTFASGDIIGLAADLDNKKVWLRQNGGAWNGSGNPATNTGGFDISALQGSGAVYVVGYTDWPNTGPYPVATANFGASSYGTAAPSGFGNW
jgi:hypothetical protein